MRPVERRTDPSTSHEAAWSLRDLGDLQRRVLAVIDSMTAATDEQLVDAYIAEHGPVSPSTVRTRRRELQDIGAIVVIGRGVTRGGRPCQVFQTAPLTASQA